MTDRLKGVVVTFEKDIREDDAQEIISAIRLLRNVLTVKGVTTDFEDGMIRDRVRMEYYEKIRDVLDGR